MRPRARCASCRRLGSGWPLVPKGNAPEAQADAHEAHDEPRELMSERDGTAVATTAPRTSATSNGVDDYPWLQIPGRCRPTRRCSGRRSAPPLIADTLGGGKKEARGDSAPPDTSRSSRHFLPRRRLVLAGFGPSLRGYLKRLPEFHSNDVVYVEAQASALRGASRVTLPPLPRLRATNPSAAATRQSGSNSASLGTPAPRTAPSAHAGQVDPRGTRGPCVRHRRTGVSPPASSPSWFPWRPPAWPGRPPTSSRATTPK